MEEQEEREVAAERARREADERRIRGVSEMGGSAEKMPWPRRTTVDAGALQGEGPCNRCRVHPLSG